jgi:hypothetical protein
MSYQAVIRTSDNQLVINRAVRMRISLLPDSMTATANYVETHQLTTNTLGVVQLEIGGGTVVSGSFVAIPWSRGKMFIKTETDPAGGTNYTLTSTTQLMSVPYAFYAGDVPVTKNGDTVTVGQSKMIIPGSILLPKGGPAPASLADGLVAYYPFNGNANDASGKGNNGVVNGAVPAIDRLGNPNQAYAFNGTSSHIRVNNSASLNNPSFSISGWFWANSLPVDPAMSVKEIISKWWQTTSACNGNYNAFNVSLTKPVGTSVRFGCATSFYAGHDFYSTSEIKTGAWVHFVFIHDAAVGGKIYINGKLESSNSNKGVVCNSTNPILIGCDSDGGTLYRYFDGKIDDIRIHSRTLTESEISYLSEN